jgi:hypothetical protein
MGLGFRQAGKRENFQDKKGCDYETREANGPLWHDAIPLTYYAPTDARIESMSDIASGC